MQSSPGSEPAAEAPASAGPDDLQEELARMEDRFKRALADLDNYRKRAAREIEQRVQEGREQLVRDLLEPLDSLERGLRAGPEGPCYAGMRSILGQFHATLRRHGV